MNDESIFVSVTWQQLAVSKTLADVRCDENPALLGISS
jgi:hypothetical protein